MQHITTLKMFPSFKIIVQIYNKKSEKYKPNVLHLLFLKASDT